MKRFLAIIIISLAAIFSIAYLAQADLRVLTIPQGGTGTSTLPSYGQLLVGNSNNGYDLASTSSLNISITETDPVWTADKPNYFLTDLFGTYFYNYFSTTNTDHLAEGVSNLYYTDARVGSYISGSSTIPHVGNMQAGDMLYFDGLGYARVPGNSSPSTTLFLSQFNNTQPHWESVPNPGSFSFYLQSVSSTPISYLLASGANTTTQVGYSFNSISVSTTIKTWITSSSTPGLTNIPAGIWKLHLDVAKTAGIKDLRFYGDVFKYNGTSETLLFKFQESDIVTGGDASNPIEVDLDSSQSSFTITSDDRIGVRVYAVPSGVGSNPSGTIYIQDQTLSRFELPSATISADNFIPYTGALHNVDLNAKDLLNVGLFSTGKSSGYNLGKFYVDSSGNVSASGTLQVYGTTTSTINYLQSTLINATSLCINGDCRTAWPSSGGGTNDWGRFGSTFGTTTLMTSTTRPVQFDGPVYASSTVTSTFDHLHAKELSIGSLTGVIRAVAGYIYAGLVNLATEVTGILGIDNGGTGLSLSDLVGQAGKFLKVNAGEDGYEFGTVAGGPTITSQSGYPTFWAAQTFMTINHPAVAFDSNKIDFSCLALFPGQDNKIENFTPWNSNAVWTFTNFNINNVDFVKDSDTTGHFTGVPNTSSLDYAKLVVDPINDTRLYIITWIGDGTDVGDITVYGSLPGAVNSTTTNPAIYGMDAYSQLALSNYYDYVNYHVFVDRWSVAKSSSGISPPAFIPLVTGGDGTGELLGWGGSYQFPANTDIRLAISTTTGATWFACSSTDWVAVDVDDTADFAVKGMKPHSSSGYQEIWDCSDGTTPATTTWANLGLTEAGKANVRYAVAMKSTDTLAYPFIEAAIWKYNTSAFYQKLSIAQQGNFNADVYVRRITTTTAYIYNNSFSTNYDDAICSAYTYP